MTCERGYYCPDKIYMIPCEKGTYNDIRNTSNSLSCTKCAPGTYNDIEGLPTPCTKTCDIGRIPTATSSECTFCPLLRLTYDNITCNSYLPSWILGISYILFSIICLYLISKDPIYTLNAEPQKKKEIHDKNIIHGSIINGRLCL
jgi:hypothetical protein